MVPHTPSRAPLTIPVVDLCNASRDPEARANIFSQMHRACREMGFFYVANHGVPAEVCTQAMEATRLFMAAPDAVKQSVDAGRSLRGYEGPGRQMLEPGTPADLKESFQFNIDSESDPTNGNRWPAAIPEMREPLLRYMRHMLELGHYLMECLAGSLEMSPGYFNSGLVQPSCSVRALRYPPLPQDAPINQLGAGAHTDWGAITILMQDDVGGLEVSPQSDWISAIPMAGCFIINLGDMVRRWTNDFYQSTLHRVQNNRSLRDRYSLACFYGPDDSYRVSVVPTCSSQGEPLYAPCTVGEHVSEMIRLTYGVGA